jgi:hypothetical protein
MIPPADALLHAYESLGRRVPASPRAVHAALEAARVLASNESEEPAALLFAFASYRRAFPGAWRFMALSIAVQQARSLGFELDASPAEYDTLLSAVLYRTFGYEDVRTWVSTHLRPLHQS